MSSNAPLVSMLIAMAIALVVATFATPLVRRMALAGDILDRPDGWRKRQRAPVPLLGGLGVFVAWLAGLAVAPDGAAAFLSSTSAVALLASVTLLCLLGACDDIWRIRAGWKLLGQAAALLPLVALGSLIDRIELFGASVELGYAAVPLTLIWYLAGVNAFNFIDGLDGLASICGLLTALTVAAWSAAFGNALVGLAAASLAGALVGFLVLNLPPATIYLGDSGSMVVGLVASWLALAAARDAPAAINPWAMCLLLALPLGDLGLAIFRRALVGWPIWQPDRGHVHHRLLDQQLSVARTLAILAFVSLAGMVLAVAVLTTGLDLLGLVAGLAVAALLVRARLAGHWEWQLGRLAFSRRWRAILGREAEVVGEWAPATPAVARLIRKPPPLVLQMRVSAAGDHEYKLAIEASAPAGESRGDWPRLVVVCGQLAIEILRRGIGRRAQQNQPKTLGDELTFVAPYERPPNRRAA